MITIDNLVHDIINKISIIHGQCRAYSRGVEVDWKNVEGACNEIIEITKNFHDQKDELQCFRGEAIRDILHTLSMSATLLNSNLDISYDVNLESEDVIYLNHNYLKTILRNAIENSINAGSNKLIFGIKKYQYYTEISIQDNGKGMSEEQINSLGFGFTTGGTGQGAMFIQKLSCEMNSKVAWESRLGEGTKFILRCKNCNSLK